MKRPSTSDFGSTSNTSRAAPSSSISGSSWRPWVPYCIARGPDIVVLFQAASPRRRTPRIGLRRRATGALIALLALGPALIGVQPVAAAPGDIGFEGPSYTGAGSAPTGSKPESKLWYNDGFWWGDLWSASAGAFHIWRLDLGGQQWIDTGVALDNRTGTRSDVLWDGTKLYVLSHRYSTAPAAGYAVRLYRFSYTAAGKTYTLDAGFPAQIHDF